jgi:hypothetical protein
MLPFILYLAAGLVTALHLYVLLSLAVLGGPQSGLEFVALFGSLGLGLSAYAALFRPRLGSMLALPSSILSWAFYGPAILATLTGAHRQLTTNLRIVALPYTAVILLVLATVHAAITTFRSRKIESAANSWLFPRTTSSAFRMIVGLCSLALVIATSGWFGFSHKTVMRRSSQIVIPAGYVGWVRVEFQVAGAPALPVEGQYYRLEIPRNGLLRTSSSEQFGLSQDAYFYRSADHLQALPSTVGSSGRMIWGRMNGETGPAKDATKYEQLFVGTEEQFKQEAGGASAGSSAVGSRASGTVAK